MRVRNMISSIVLSGAAFLTGLAAAADKDAESAWTSSHEAREEVTVFEKGREVAIYHSGPALDKPYFHPIRTPDRRVITYDAPADHVHHRGLSVGWPDISNADFWAEVNTPKGRRGKLATRGLKSEPHPDGGMVIGETNAWMAEDGTVLMNESRHYRFLPSRGNLQLIDVEMLFQALADEVIFGSDPDKPREYHGLTLRIGPFDDVRFYNSEGDEGDVACHGKASRWVAVSGLQAGGPVTTAILDHQDNSSFPSNYFVLGRGMQFISTSPNFGKPKFITKGRTWRLRYRVVAAGAPPEGKPWDMQALWTEFNEE